MLNKVILQGRLTKDPEPKKTQSGISNVLFTVAWSEKYKEVETKCFLLCKAWRNVAEFICKYFRKGQEIAIEGRMITERWGDNDHDTTYCVIDKAHFCGPKPAADRQETPSPSPSTFVPVPDSDQEELPFE